MNATSLLNAVLEKYRGTTRFIRDRELGRRVDVNVETLTSYIDNIRTSQVDVKDVEILVKRVLVPALSKGTGTRKLLEAAYTDLHAIALMTLAKVPESKLDILTPHVGVLVGLLQNKYKTSTYNAIDVYHRVITILHHLEPVIIKDHVRELLKALDMEEFPFPMGLYITRLLQNIPNVNWNVYALELQKNKHFFNPSFLKKHIQLESFIDKLKSFIEDSADEDEPASTPAVEPATPAHSVLRM